MVWKGLTIVQLHNKDFRIPPNLTVDYLIISNNAIKNLSAVVSEIEAKEFIVDSSNSFYRAERLLLDAEKYGIEIFSVLHQGAFDLTI